MTTFLIVYSVAATLVLCYCIRGWWLAHQVVKELTDMSTRDIIEFSKLHKS